MLYFNPPYFVINGISLLPDHEDPLQWYYMPVAPHFRSEPDNSLPGNPEIPMISLIKYRGNAGNGGIIDFDVNLLPPQIVQQQLWRAKKPVFVALVFLSDSLCHRRGFGGSFFISNLHS